MIKFPKIQKKTLVVDPSMPTTSSFSSFDKANFSKDLKRTLPRRTRSKNQKHQQNQKAQKRPLKSCLKTQENDQVKAVSFDKSARVRRVRARNTFSKQEQDAMWYTENDYAEIKQRAVDTVKRMIKVERSGVSFCDDDEYTARGLECKMRRNAMARKEFKAMARSLVLTEQELQEATQSKCSTKLRKVYIKASSISASKAHEYGRIDAEAVNDISLSNILTQINLEHKKYNRQ